jgi:hypothetical protein
MSEPDPGDGAARVPLDPSEPADGVKVDGQSNYFPWIEPEPEPEMDDDSEYREPFPWSALVWFLLLAMLAAAIGAMVSGK